MMNKKFAAVLAAAATSVALMAGCSSNASNGGDAPVNNGDSGQIVVNGNAPTSGSTVDGQKPSGTPASPKMFDQSNVPSWAQATEFYGDVLVGCQTGYGPYDIDGNGTQSGNLGIDMWPGGHYEVSNGNVDVWFDDAVPSGVIVRGAEFRFFQFDQGHKFYHMSSDELGLAAGVNENLGQICGER